MFSFFRYSLFAAFLSGITFSSMAGQSVAIDYLHGFDDIKGVRVAYRPVTTSLYTDWFGDIKLYWEASFNVW